MHGVVLREHQVFEGAEQRAISRPPPPRAAAFIAKQDHSRIISPHAQAQHARLAVQLNQSWRSVHGEPVENLIELGDSFNLPRKLRMLD